MWGFDLCFAEVSYLLLPLWLPRSLLILAYWTLVILVFIKYTFLHIFNLLKLSNSWRYIMIMGSKRSLQKCMNNLTAENFPHVFRGSFMTTQHLSMYLKQCNSSNTGSINYPEKYYPKSGHRFIKNISLQLF